MPNIQDWIRMYSSTNRDVRLRAAKGLLGRSEDAPLDLLIDILMNLSHEGLGANTERALLERNDPELVPRMIGLLESHDDFVRQVACTVLGRSRDVTATPHLLRMVDDSNVMVRRAAGFGLAFLKDRSALEEVTRLHDRRRDDDIDVVMALECAMKSLSEDE